MAGRSASPATESEMTLVTPTAAKSDAFPEDKTPVPHTPRTESTESLMATPHIEEPLIHPVPQTEPLSRVRTVSDAQGGDRTDSGGPMHAQVQRTLGRELKRHNSDPNMELLPPGTPGPVHGHSDDEATRLPVRQGSKFVAFRRPVPDAPQRTRGNGLTSQEASTKLVSTLRGWLKEKQMHSLTFREALVKQLFTLPTPLLLICAIILAISASMTLIDTTPSDNIGDDVRSWLIESSVRATECALLFTLAFVNCIICARESVLQAREMLTRANKVVDDLEHSKGFYLDAMRDPSAPATPSCALLSVLRDGQWKRLPPNLLVIGDLVELSLGDMAPTALNSVMTLRPFSIGAGERYLSPMPCVCASNAYRRVRINQPEFDPTHGHDSAAHALGAKCLFVLDDTPAVASLRVAFNLEPNSVVTLRSKKDLDLKRPLAAFSAFVQKVDSLLYRGFVASMFAALVLNSLWSVFQVNVADFWFDKIITALLLRQIYLAFMLLPFATPLFLALTNAYGNARMLALFDLLQETQSHHLTRNNLDSDDSSDSDRSDAGNAIGEMSFHIPMRTLFKYFRSIVTAPSPSLVRTTNLMHTMGTVTVVCAMDTEGIISQPVPHMEKVFIPQAESSQPVVLTAIKVEGGRFRFDRTNWEEFLPSLKPIALASIVNPMCTNMKSNLLADNRLAYLTACQRRMETSCAGRQCMCQLGLHVGFTAQGIEQYVVKKEFYIFTSPTVPEEAFEDGAAELEYRTQATPFMSIVLVEGPGGGLQALTKGTPDFVLEHCTEFFDGKHIAEIDDDDRARFEETALQWQSHYCCAFSYRPIQIDMAAIFGRPKGEEIPAGPILIEVTPQGAYRQLPESECNGKVVDSVMGRMLNGQIFLGMLNMGRSPKTGAPVVDELRDAGVRFVYFSQDGERVAKNFAAKLGVEIDFNCCISLQEHDPHNPKDTRAECEVRARLPRGISEIRPHLERVDNVPLLVPIFADANPPSMAAMIKIFQENGDVVLTLGSAQNHYNSGAFAQADVAVAAQPSLPRRCVRHHGNRQLKRAVLEPTNDEHVEELDKTVNSRQLGVSITALPCSMVAHRDTSLVTVMQLLKESRRLLANIQQCALFVLVSQVSVGALILLGYAVAMPPIFPLWQGMWYIMIIVPMFGLPMMATPPDPDTMKILPTKNISHVPFPWHQAKRLSYRILPTVVLCVFLYVIFVATFQELQNLPFRFALAYAVPNINATSEWQQRFAAIMYARALVMWLMTLYLVPISASYLHPTRSLWEFRPWRNRMWILGSLSGLATQTVCTVVYCATATPAVPISLARLPWWVYVLVFVWPLAIILIDELVKRPDRKKFLRNQRELQLEFNTRLGMHSPV